MSDKKPTPLRATCHCGALAVTLPRLPAHINHCQCTICRRYGVAWAYYRPDEVVIATRPGAVIKQYIWGDREISFNFCDGCGCVVFWWPIDLPIKTTTIGEEGGEGKAGTEGTGGEADGGEKKVGINTNNMNPELLRFVDRTYGYWRVKKPVGSKEVAHPDDLADY